MVGQKQVNVEFFLNSCKRVFTEEPKRVATKSVAKSEDEKKKTPAELLSRAAAKGTLAVSASGLPPLRAGKVTITASTRGRGRGIPRVKPPEAEPVILTLSSDEEGDEDKSNKSAKVRLSFSIFSSVVIKMILLDSTGCTKPTCIEASFSM